jgi:hypothetical protein
MIRTGSKGVTGDHGQPRHEGRGGGARAAPFSAPVVMVITGDGGTTWTGGPLPQSGVLNGVARPSASVCCAVGSTVNATGVEYARLLRGQGHSYSQIAARTSIPKTSLHRYLTPAPAGEQAS